MAINKIPGFSKLLSAVALCSLFTACDGGRTTTIVHRTDNHREEIKYEGSVVLNPAKSQIESISKGGYLRYEEDGQAFEARDEKGHITYAFNGDSEITTLNAEQQSLVAKVVSAVQKSRRQ